MNSSNLNSESSEKSSVINKEPPRYYALRDLSKIRELSPIMHVKPIDEDGPPEKMELVVDMNKDMSLEIAMPEQNKVNIINVSTNPANITIDLKNSPGTNIFVNDKNPLTESKENKDYYFKMNISIGKSKIILNTILNEQPGINKKNKLPELIIHGGIPMPSITDIKKLNTDSGYEVSIYKDNSKPMLEVKPLPEGEKFIFDMSTSEGLNTGLSINIPSKGSEKSNWMFKMEASYQDGSKESEFLVAEVVALARDAISQNSKNEMDKGSNVNASGSNLGNSGSIGRSTEQIGSALKAVDES